MKGILINPRRYANEINLGFLLASFSDETFERAAVEIQHDEEIEIEEAQPEPEIVMPTNVKVSTGCGPSPDREIEEIFANDFQESSTKAFTPLREIPSRSQVSIGTSPPPQDTSTQVRRKIGKVGFRKIEI